MTEIQGLQSPREYLKLKYMGACKCGDCQLVPAKVLATWAELLEKLPTRDAAEGAGTCASCGLTHREHSINGAAYGVCGKFVEVATPQPAPDAVRSGKVHYLKTWPKYFEEVLSGRKGFEWRFADRDFAIGDTLVLQEWKPERENYKSKEGAYTGREIERLVTYLFVPPPTNERTVVMAIAPLSAPVPSPDGAGEIRFVTDEDREYASELLADLTNDDLPRLEIAARWFRKARVERSPSSGTGAAELGADCTMWDWDKIAEAAFQRACLSDHYAADQLRPAFRAIIEAGLAATPPVRGNQPIDLDAFRPFANFISDPLFEKIPDEEILTAGSALTRSKITYGELRALSRAMLRLFGGGDREAIALKCWKNGKLEFCTVHEFVQSLRALANWADQEFSIRSDPSAHLGERLRAAADALLSSPVQPGAGETRQGACTACGGHGVVRVPVVGGPYTSVAERESHDNEAEE